MNDIIVDDYRYLRNQLQETLEAWEDDVRNEDVESFHYLLKERLKYLDSFKLYRYTKADIYNIRNFEKQIIHLTGNGKFNDIYEGLPSSQIQELSPNDFKILSDVARITCFSESVDNLLMWSHYADSHKGFCVEYDLKLLNTQDDVLKHIFPIVYQPKRFIRTNIQDIVEGMVELNEAIYQNSDYDEQLLMRILPLFVTKGDIWKYEKEWRAIYTKLEMYEKDDYLENIPFTCVTGIYLGHRIEPLVKEMVVEIVERLSKQTGRNIAIYESILSNSEYTLSFKKIN